MKRRTFTVPPSADKLNRCARCGRHLRAGQRATIRVEPGRATHLHAGRSCPASYQSRPL